MGMSEKIQFSSQLDARRLKLYQVLKSLSQLAGLACISITFNMPIRTLHDHLYNFAQQTYIEACC